MLLGFIFSILTASYSIVSFDSVAIEGSMPEYSTYKYECTATTGRYGQLTSGQSCCLTLGGWEECRIKSISLQMRSNTNSGSGSLQVMIDGSFIWSIADSPFASEYWVGKYSTEWVLLEREINKLVKGPIEIKLKASENSLYINRYTITYEPIQPRPYEVKFITGLDTMLSPLLQSSVDQELILPQWSDTAMWHFIGWSESEVWEEAKLQRLLPPGSKYVPKRDMTLYAVYADNEMYGALRKGEELDADYMICGKNSMTDKVSKSGMAMCGSVNDGTVDLCPVFLVDEGGKWRWSGGDIGEDLMYTIEWIGGDSLRMWHTKSGKYIGHKGARLYAADTYWRYKWLDDGSLAIYYIYNNKGYALYFGLYSQNPSGDPVAYVHQLEIRQWTKGGLWLFPTNMVEYTSWPFGKTNAVDNIQWNSSVKGEYMMNWGSHKVYIKDGKKYLLLNGSRVF